MNDMTPTPQLFKALTDTGMRPEAARRIERELKSSIAWGITRHQQDGHALLMTKADGMALENTLRAEMTEIKFELRQEMAEMKVDLRHEMAQVEARLMRYINDHGWKMMGVQMAMLGVMMGVMLTAFKYLH